MKGSEDAEVSIRSLALAGLGAALVWGAWALTRAYERPVPPGREPAAAIGPAEARQELILKANAGKPGDPGLMERYAAINARHFGGVLSEIVVRWEPALADVGPLSGQDFSLQGMFGRTGSQSIILLNPSLRDDARAIDRALCHEIVHAYLFATGDRSTSHGPPFQAQLQRLAAEGAFEGIAADAGERARLRAWLDAESARIDEERRAMDALEIEIRQTGADLDRDIAAFNARAERPAAEAEVLEGRRTAFNQRVLEANDRLQRDRDDLAQFNREVNRYNLMMAYPDGLDEASLVPVKPARPGAGR
jgi:hypothetical protein